MVLPAPNLDDRDFQALVDDAKRLVQRRCPEWTDHNVSDPGVTLIEAFAQMVDQLIYRVNRVPDRSYVKFLELLGLRLFPPTAARGTATFWLAAAQPATVLVRAETEVATPRTDVDAPIVFATTADLPIVSCEFSFVASSGAGGEATDLSADMAGGRQVAAFSDRPQVGDALLVGLSAATPSCAVLLRFDCPVGGVGIDPTDPPLVWEAWNGSGWTRCEVDKDETGGFNRPGDVVVHVPAGHSQTMLARHRAGWLRCRTVQADRFYTRSPRIASIRAMTIGGTAGIVHAETVRDEALGVSDGTPGQRFTLQRHPVLPWEEPDTIQARDERGELLGVWSASRDFAGSGEEDRHYRLDPVSGEIEFGPAVRQPDGSITQHGAIPPKGVTLRLSAYRVGGGPGGNVARNMISVLKTSVPYVNRVQNRHPAAGGVDAETMTNARLRGPLELRSSGRAVTADDFEVLARDVAPDAARVRCVPVSDDAAETGGADVRSGVDPGVRLLVVPQVITDEDGKIEYGAVSSPPEELMRRIGEHLDGRRLVGTRLVVEPPAYTGVTVVARISREAGSHPDRVQQAAVRSLYRYLSPLVGGAEGDGWPFGRPVDAFDLSAVLSRVPGVSLVDELLLFTADPESGRRASPVRRIDLEPHALVFSYQHQVRFR